MMRNGIISFHIILLLLPAAVKAGIYDPIIEQIRPGNIVIIGETHQRPESAQLIQGLIKTTCNGLQSKTCKPAISAIFDRD